MLLMLIVPREPGASEIEISQVIQMAEANKIEKIKVAGDKLVVTATGGDIFKSRKESGVSLLEILDDKGVATGLRGVRIEVGEEGSGIFPILASLFAIILFGGLIIFMMRRTQGGINRAMSVGKSTAREVVDDKPTVSFNDVAGADEAKQELAEVVEFLRNPTKFTKLGAKIPKGILLVGPPGTGKTLISKAMAGEADVRFFSTSGSEFVEIFVGVGASRVRDLFSRAKKFPPAVIFIDEIDAVSGGPHHQDSGEAASSCLPCTGLSSCRYPESPSCGQCGP